MSTGFDIASDRLIDFANRSLHPNVRHGGGFGREDKLMSDRHVTSEAIRAAGASLGGEVRDLVLEIKRSIDETSVPFPAFGVVGGRR